MARTRCPLCGAPGSACGPPGTHPLLDTPDPSMREPGMPLKLYDVTINGLQTTLRLSDADAKARGLTGGRPLDGRKARAASSKVADAESKTTPPADGAGDPPAPPPADKPKTSRGARQGTSGT